MAVKKVAGSKLYIGGAVPYESVVQLSDFAGQTWVEIDGWQNWDTLGAEQEVLTQTLINQNITIYAKGVISLPIMANAFVPMPTNAGQIAMMAAQRSCKPYAFKLEHAGDCGDQSVVTISNATPGVVSWTAHGLANGTPVTFSTTASLPAPLAPSTIYFVVSAATDSFSVAASPGGTAIDTNTAGSGTHTAFALPIGETDLFYGMALRGTKTGGDASANRLINMPIQPIAEFITV